MPPALRAYRRRVMGRAIDRRPFGKTGHVVTAIGLGTLALGRSPRVNSDAQAVEIVRAAFEGGINFIDTAPLYGEAERRLGIALAELKDLIPADFVLNTKAGYRPDPFDYSEAKTLACVEQSLKLLGLERLHVVHIHDVERSDFKTVMNGARKALHKLQEQKIVGHVGVSGGPVDLLLKYVETGEFESVITHNRHTLLDQPALPLIKRAKELGLAVINAAPFASGILARPFDPAAPYVYHQVSTAVAGKVARLSEICARHGVDLPTAAVRLSVRNPDITTTVLGAAFPEEVGVAVAACHAELPEVLWEELERSVPPNTLDDVEFWRRTGQPSATL